MKKTVFILVILLVSGFILGAQEQGDVNHNGKVDIVDALLIAQYYVSLNPDINLAVADVNCDTLVSIVDSLLVAQYYVNLIGPFQPCATETPTPIITIPPTLTPVPDTGFSIGADVSEAKYATEQGVVYKDTDGTPGHYLDIFKNHGFQWVRVRVLVNPPGEYGLYQSTSYTRDVILDAKARGFKVLLVFFYSDWWCDPGQNAKPAAWPSNSTQLQNTLYNYTRDTLLTIGTSNIDMVAVGNEIDNAMCGTTGTAKRDLVNRGYDAVKSVSDLPVMVQSAEGDYSWFSSLGAKVDVYGISYYMMWHGDLNDMGQRIASFGSRKMWVIETAMYWTRSDASFSTPGYGQNQDGQYQYMKDVKAKAQSYNNCEGIMYWGATWAQTSSWLYAPTWGNDDAGTRSLFDNNAKATRGIEGWE